MMMVVLFLEKQAMVFLLGEVALQQSGEKVDKGMDFILGETLAEEIGKLPPSGELQEAGKGLLIQLFAQAETDVLGVDGHGRGGENGGYYNAAGRMRQWILLLRGPSNSQKNIFCQVPSTRLWSAIKTVREDPMRDAMMWAGELPSRCL
jgi:hypothetical protein